APPTPGAPDVGPGFDFQSHLEATISGEQLGYLFASSDFKDYGQGKQLTISVDEAAAGALYAAAMGIGYGATAPVPQLTSQIASDPMACQILWHKDGTPGANPSWQQANFYGHQNSNQLSLPHLAQQNQWQHDPYARYNPQYQNHLAYQQYFRNQERPLSSRRGAARAKRDNARELPSDEEQKEDKKASGEASPQDGPKKSSGKHKASSHARAPKKPKVLSDLLVVSTRPGEPGDRAILECTAPESASQSSEEDPGTPRRKTLLQPVQMSNISQVMFDEDLFEDEEEEDKESDEVVVVEDKPSISHKQAQSAHLLASLQRMGEQRGATAPAAQLPPKPLTASPPHRLRPKTSPFVGKAPQRPHKGYRCYGSVTSRPTTVGSATASDHLWTRPGTVETKSKTPAETEQAPSRPDWDTSFYSMHQRRIPTYDALIDENCPVLSSPARLRQIIETRELPDAYLHIVRARFEQHRQMFDRDGRLGERSRPEPCAVPQEPPRYPDRLVERMVSGFDAEGVDTKVKPPAISLDALCQEYPPAKPLGQPSHQILCSSEWQNSALHDEIVDCGDEVPPAVDLEDLEVTEQGTLVPSWKKVEGEVKLLWHRLQIPLDLRTSLNDGALASVTPGNLYQIQAHLKRLQSFEISTRKLISKWLTREKLLEQICTSHALGVNDNRLVSLKANVQKLDKISSSLVSEIGIWGRRFADFVVDASRDPLAPTTLPKPRPIFVWGGRDAIERIQSDAERLVRGDMSVFHQPQQRDDEASKHAGSDLEGDHSLSQRFKDWGFASSTSRYAKGSKSQKASSAGLPTCTLAAATVSAQSFKVTDVLFEGPAPSWYRAKVAKAGIKALKRGLPCGGGDKRM
ncbi:slc38a6, partial [Symbiodinium sp. CCMP2456]